MSLIKINTPGRRYFRQSLLTSLLTSQLVFAAQACTTDCSIAVNFIGTYNDETCQVVINNASSHEVVTLPKISTASLKDDRSEAGSVPFEIKLTDCPASRTVTVFFNSSVSSADSETGNLLNDSGAGYSRNVQVRIRKENNASIVIDNASSGQDYLIPATAEALSHRFTASYYAKGNSAVTAGRVHTVAGVELVYK